MTLLQEINRKIKSLARAEKVTKARLGELSTELLIYVLGDDLTGLEASHDIDAVNRTLAVLTPMNKRTAVLYFTHFLPFSFDEETCKFGGMNKKAYKKVNAMTQEFLGTDGNIWTWAAENIKVEKKEIDYAKKISDDIRKALDEDKGGLSAKDVFNAVLEGGLTAADLVACIEMMAEQQLKEVA